MKKLYIFEHTTTLQQLETIAETELQAREQLVAGEEVLTHESEYQLIDQQTVYQEE